MEQPGAPRIIMLDDHPHVFPILVMIMKTKWPHADIEIFEHGQLAAQAIVRNPPDLLITDLNHPGTGTRQLMELGNFPVLIISGYLDGNNPPHSFPQRVQFLSKPFSIPEFETALANFRL